MSYASVDDVSNLGLPSRVTDDDSGISEEVIQYHLDNASSLIDSYLISQYKLPLVSPCPAVIKQKCIDITVYTLLKQRGFDPSGSDAIFVKAYDDTLAWLTQLAKGTVHLPPGSDSTSGYPSDGSAQVGSHVSANSNAGFCFGSWRSSRGW